MVQHGAHHPQPHSKAQPTPAVKFGGGSILQACAHAAGPSTHLLGVCRVCAVCLQPARIDYQAGASSPARFTQHRVVRLSGVMVDLAR
eukprot:COSAG01_NODE_37242_length_506_cov_0.975430_1_plen_87_part_10